MSTTYFLSQGDLATLVTELVAAGTRVVAPVTSGERRDYRAVRSFDEVKLAGAEPPRQSVKKELLPATEPLFRWRQKQNDFALEEVPATYASTVILGATPCDAAGVQTLDKVMGWDYVDEPWFGRRQATTIVAVACASGDASCFCTSVGLGPDATKGVDVLLVPVEGGYFAEVLSDKGEALVAGHRARFAAEKGRAEADAYRQKARAAVAANGVAEAEPVRQWLEGHFEDPFWADVALRCHGCGACASVCPTCHCFDIVDEAEAVDRGTRRRNWDTCQTAKFTVHGSGHNPRTQQNVRMRQRVLHKFFVYPKRFGEVLCTGCGRCSRACPGGMDLPEILNRIATLGGAR